MGFDITGLIMTFIVLGVSAGYVLGRIGSIHWLLGVVAAMLALIIWLCSVAAQDTSWYSVLNIIGIAAVMCGTVVMIVTYVMVGLIRREDAHATTGETDAHRP